MKTMKRKKINIYKVTAVLYIIIAIIYLTIALF